MVPKAEVCTADHDMVAWEALRLAPAFSEDIILTASGEDRLAAWEATREEITVAT